VRTSDKFVGKTLLYVFPLFSLLAFELFFVLPLFNEASWEAMGFALFLVLLGGFFFFVVAHKLVFLCKMYFAKIA